MNAFQLLRSDHQKAEQMMNKLMNTRDDATRGSLFSELKRELDVHAEIEEEIFYPALRSAKETSDLVKESLHEHDVMKRMLSKMERMDHSGSQWSASLDELKQNVEHHVHEEEEEMFQKAERLLSWDMLEELGDRMQRRKNDLMKHS